MQGVNVLLMIIYVILFMNILQIWGLNKAMVPPLSFLYYFLIGCIHTYYNILQKTVPALKKEQPILLHRCNYLCWLTLMIWSCLLLLLRSYRPCCIVYPLFVMPIPLQLILGKPRLCLLTVMHRCLLKIRKLKLCHNLSIWVLC
jgi:hypothetical protein